MATTINAGSLFLAAASPRLLTAPNADIILKATSNIFHVNTAGVSDTASTIITATLISLEGTVEWSAVGATLASVSGNTAVLAFTGMAGTKATVTATLTYRGVVFSDDIVISVVSDGSIGSDGADGTAGSRGAGHFYATDSAWTDAAANAATPGENVIDDVVTISDGTAFVSEKKWTGTAWADNGLVLDGNLIVPGSVTASKINSNGLDVRKTDGTIILSAGGLQVGFEAPGTLNSDLPLGGRNMLPANSLPSSAEGFTAQVSVTGFTWSGPLYVPDQGGTGFDQYSPTHRGVVYVYAAGTPNGGTYIDLYKDLATPYQVVTGRRYEFSVALSAHRCDSQVRVVWYDAVGGVVGTGEGQYISTVSDYNAVDFPRSKLFAVAPVDAVKVMMFVRQLHNGTGSECYTFTSQWYAGEASSTQTVASPWSESPTSVSAGIANKLNKNADDILGGILSIDTVTAPAGFRAGSLTWDAAGDRTGGYGVAMTPKGLVGYKADGTLTLSMSATTGDIAVKGDISGSTGTFGAVTIGSTMSMGQSAYNTGTGAWFQGGATPKMSMKTANGATFLCDPANNIMSLNGASVAGLNISDSPALAAISDISGGCASTGATVTITTVSPSGSGGKAPYKFTWSSNYTNNGGVTIFYTLNAAGDVATIKCLSRTAGANSSLDITVLMVDANGLAVSRKFNVYADCT